MRSVILLHPSAIRRLKTTFPSPGPPILSLLIRWCLSGSLPQVFMSSAPPPNFREKTTVSFFISKRESFSFAPQLYVLALLFPFLGICSRDSFWVEWTFHFIFEVLETGLLFVSTPPPAWGIRFFPFILFPARVILSGFRRKIEPIFPFLLFLF